MAPAFVLCPVQTCGRGKCSALEMRWGSPRVNRPAQPRSANYQPRGSPELGFGGLDSNKVILTSSWTMLRVERGLGPYREHSWTPTPGQRSEQGPQGPRKAPAPCPLWNPHGLCSQTEQKLLWLILLILLQTLCRFPPCNPILPLFIPLRSILYLVPLSSHSSRTSSPSVILKLKCI